MLGIGLVLALVLAASAGRADVPAPIDYQGFLLGTGGSPVQGVLPVEVRLYSDPLSSAPADLVYSETHLSVPIVDGVFFLEIGTGAGATPPFGPDLLTATEVWLELEIDGEVLQPRQRVESVAYALKSADAAALEGVLGSELQQRVLASCPAGSAIRSISATGSVLCEIDDDAGGDVSSATAGLGLTGGGGTGDVSLAVDFNQVQRRVTGLCPVGSGLTSIAVDGSVSCAVDQIGTNQLEGVIAGTGLFVSGFRDFTVSVAFQGITEAFLADGAVSNAALQDDAVPNAKLAPQSVTGDKVEVGSLQWTVFAHESVTAADLAPDSVSGATLDASAFSHPRWEDITSLQTLTSVDSAVCFLTEVYVRELDNSGETGTCRIYVSGGDWVVHPIVAPGFNGEVRCGATCLVWR